VNRLFFSWAHSALYYWIGARKPPPFFLCFMPHRKERISEKISLFFPLLKRKGEAGGDEWEAEVFPSPLSYLWRFNYGMKGRLEIAKGFPPPPPLFPFVFGEREERGLEKKTGRKRFLPFPPPSVDYADDGGGTRTASHSRDTLLFPPPLSFECRQKRQRVFRECVRSWGISPPPPFPRQFAGPNPVIEIAPRLLPSEKHRAGGSFFSFPFPP